MSCLPFLRCFLAAYHFLMIFPFLKWFCREGFCFLRQDYQSCFDSDQAKIMGAASFFLEFYPHKNVPELFLTIKLVIGISSFTYSKIAALYF